MEENTLTNLDLRAGYKKTILCSYVGYITQAIVNIFVPLLFVTFTDEFGVSLSEITLLTTLNFLTQLIVDLAGAAFVDKIGYRKCIVMAHLFSAAGLLGLSFIPSLLGSPYIGLLICVVLYAVGGGLIEVLISPIVEACPTDDKASAMSLLHSFYCWGSAAVILISTAFFALFGRESWRIMSCIWAVIPAVNAFCFMRVPINTLTEKGESMSIRGLFSAKIFWILAAMMLCAGASELSMSQWASAFAESGLGVTKSIGDLAGPFLFSILMGSSRVFYSKYSDKIPLDKFIAGSSVLCIAAYLLTVFSPIPALSLVGCSLCGLSVGIMWPGVFSIASAKMPKGGTAMFAILALAGDLGCCSGPTLVGFVSGAAGDSILTGLLAAAVFPILMIIMLILLSGCSRSEKVLSQLSRFS